MATVLLYQWRSSAYLWYKAAAAAGDREAAQQAERLKRALWPADTSSSADLAGSWQAAVQERPKAQLPQSDKATAVTLSPSGPGSL